MSNDIKIEIYNHCQRIIKIINKSNFKGIFNLELQDLDEIDDILDDYIYVYPIIIPESEFLMPDFEGIAGHINKRYEGIMEFHGDNRYQSLQIRLLESKNFQTTLEFDEKDFELWFKLEYGG
jgi:hypothetical protein